MIILLILIGAFLVIVGTTILYICGKYIAKIQTVTFGNTFLIGVVAGVLNWILIYIIYSAIRNNSESLMAFLNVFNKLGFLGLAAIVIFLNGATSVLVSKMIWKTNYKKATIAHSLFIIIFWVTIVGRFCGAENKFAPQENLFTGKYKQITQNEENNRIYAHADSVKNPIPSPPESTNSDRGTNQQVNSIVNKCIDHSIDTIFNVIYPLGGMYNDFAIVLTKNLKCVAEGVGGIGMPLGDYTLYLIDLKNNSVVLKSVPLSGLNVYESFKTFKNYPFIYINLKSAGGGSGSSGVVIRINPKAVNKIEQILSYGNGDIEFHESIAFVDIPIWGTNEAHFDNHKAILVGYKINENGDLKKQFKTTTKFKYDCYDAAPFVSIRKNEPDLFSTTSPTINHSSISDDSESTPILINTATVTTTASLTNHSIISELINYKWLIVLLFILILSISIYLFRKLIVLLKKNNSKNIPDEVGVESKPIEGIVNPEHISLTKNDITKSENLENELSNTLNDVPKTVTGNKIWNINWIMGGIFALFVIVGIIYEKSSNSYNSNVSSSVTEVEISGDYSGTDNVGMESTIILESSGNLIVQPSVGDGTPSYGHWKGTASNISLYIQDEQGGEELLGNAKITEKGLRIIGGNFYSRK